MRSLSRVGAALIAVGAAGLVFASVAAMVVRVSGRDIGILPLVVAGIVLTVGVLMAAATAAHAILRRRWGWAVAVLVAWPVAVPLYLRAIYQHTSPNGLH